MNTVEPDRPSTGNRIATLDGLRGIAILLVMISHFAIANPPTGHWFNIQVSRLLRSGWIGVDLFFVLSGFLITGILCDARGKEGYFRNFYMRRVLRIFPLYYASLAVLVVALPAAVGPRPEMLQMQADSFWYWSYLANIKIAVSGWPAPPEYLGHFWSLAVEEQFYLFWPLLVLVLSPGAMLRCCAVFVAAAFVVRIIIHVTGDVVAANVLTPARLDALAIGGMVALLARQTGGLRRVARRIAAVGLACGLIVVSLYAYYRGLPAGSFPVSTIGYTALAGLFASVMVAALLAAPGSLLGLVCGSRALVFFGRYSYALYVVHPAVIYFWPATLTANALQPLTGRWIIAFACASALMLAASVAVSLVSWHALEKHFLRMRFRFAGEKQAIHSGAAGPAPAQRAVATAALDRPAG